VRITERTRVTQVPAVRNGEVVVTTNRGQVRAGHAVIAVDGDLRTLVPSARHVRCRRLNMLATAPIRETVLPTPIYARYGHEWAQQLPDGRIAAGGFSDVDGEASWTRRAALSVPVQQLLDDYLHKQLRVTAPVTHRWAGLVGYASSPLPTCGPVPGTGGRLIALGGYSGTGHVQAWIAARIASQLITARASADIDLYNSAL
jgi:glycine/D-amino acid oxidase-like deaminating enzyme